MLLNGRTYKVLNLDDLNSLISLEEWVKNNLSLYPDDEKVSSNHLKTFLEYIKNNARDQRVQDKKAWFDQIDQLIERAESK
jgi:hypothetical protein